MTRSGTRRWRVLVALFLIVVAAGAGALFALRPRPVHVHVVTRGTIRVEALGTGSVESRRTIDLGFEVTGRVEELRVDQGDEVVRGQVVATIDDETYQAEVALADEEVALAQATLARLDADIARAQAVLAGAAANLARVEPLQTSGVVSEGTLDAAQERHQVAQAELARAQAAHAEGLQARSTAQRRRERARADLTRTVVSSPVDGIVLRRAREAGDIAVPGAPVLVLAATDTIWASVWVDETYLEHLAPGLPARVVLRSAPDAPCAGRVSRIGREVDRETRELLVDVTFDEPRSTPVLGQRADLWIELDRVDDALGVPLASLVRRDGREGVFLEQDGRARFHALELGRRGRELVQVRSGLAEGALVLSPTDSGGRRLKEGARVEADSATERER